MKPDWIINGSVMFSFSRGVILRNNSDDSDTASLLKPLGEPGWKGIYPSVTRRFKMPNCWTDIFRVLLTVT